MRMEVENGTFAYRNGERQILERIRFDVESGDILAVLGPNGAGKTTLLRCLLGLLRWQEGITKLDGTDIRKIKLRELWQKAAYVPQAGSTSVPYTVEEMILLGRSSHYGMFSAPGKKDVECTNAVMERLQLAHLRQKNYAQLSGGEKQMVLIARALATEAQILVLDEPESNLDFKNQLLVLDTMTELAASGIACIFNTHYPAHALRRANKSLMLGRDGSYVFGQTPEVVTEENILRYFEVATVIGDIETPGNIYQDVIPVSSGEHSLQRGEEKKHRAVATLSVIMADRSQSEKINDLLHGATEWLVGRMGMPHPDGGLYIINLVLDAPVSEIRRLTSELNLIPGVSVKATYAKEMRAVEQ